MKELLFVFCHIINLVQEVINLGKLQIKTKIKWTKERSESYKTKPKSSEQMNKSFIV